MGLFVEVSIWFCFPLTFTDTLRVQTLSTFKQSSGWSSFTWINHSLKQSRQGTSTDKCWRHSLTDKYDYQQEHKEKQITSCHCQQKLHLHLMESPELSTVCKLLYKSRSTDKIVLFLYTTVQLLIYFWFDMENCAKVSGRCILANLQMEHCLFSRKRKDLVHGPSYKPCVIQWPCLWSLGSKNAGPAQPLVSRGMWPQL